MNESVLTGRRRHLGDEAFQEWLRTRTLNKTSKASARAYANVYKRRGILKQQPCRCGSPDTQMHHRDYSRPLDVEWLCRKCHQDEHNGTVARLKTLESLVDALDGCRRLLDDAYFT
jgi:hypothetical protein